MHLIYRRKRSFAYRPRVFKLYFMKKTRVCDALSRVHYLRDPPCKNGGGVFENFNPKKVNQKGVLKNFDAYVKLKIYVLYA